MSKQYKVINPTSLFKGRVGRKVAFDSTSEIMLVFDGSRGDTFARFLPSEVEEWEGIKVVK